MGQLDDEALRISGFGVIHTINRFVESGLLPVSGFTIKKRGQDNVHIVDGCLHVFEGRGQASSHRNNRSDDDFAALEVIEIHDLPRLLEENTEIVEVKYNTQDGLRKFRILGRAREK